MTPVWETRSCRGFHSSPNEKLFVQRMLAAMNIAREGDIRFMNAYHYNGFQSCRDSRQLTSWAHKES
jgi:hypothetical protein